jgi:2-polyprenyl-6-methoxyphenol hydroxylase-like FAD-dependent oxidoreductase
MRVAINGTGVAGPTLAWWLRRYGHEPVLFEKAPKLRTGGYIIDFWGVGYNVAEKMGLLPSLFEQGYVMKALRMLGRHGRTVASLDVNTFRSLLHDRYVSIARGDLAATVFRACQGVDTRFGREIVSLDQHARGVRVYSSDGLEEEFDLVVGADGLHSHIRSLAFGPETKFEHPLGCCVAAFAVPGYRPREELVYVSYTVPQRQAFRIALRDDFTSFLLVFRDELLGSWPASTGEQRDALCKVFGDMEWEVPQILARLDEVEDLYFDKVSQIRMDRWTSGRVALIGDAAACVSLLAGEGAGLAMAEAYVLAGELHRGGPEYAAALQRYETSLRPFLAAKQKSALRFAGFFAPRTVFGMLLRNLATNLSALPIVGRLLIGGALRDDLELPDYCGDTAEEAPGDIVADSRVG